MFKEMLRAPMTLLIKFEITLSREDSNILSFRITKQIYLRQWNYKA